MKRLFSLLVIVTFLFILTACNEREVNLEIDREDQFIVGLEVNYAPFNYSQNFSTQYNYPVANQVGIYADGYDVQIAKAIAASLGKVLVIQKLDWDALIPQLEANKIDAIIAGMSPTEERKQSVLFSDGYFESTHVMLVKSDSSYKNATSLNDFNGARVVGQHGTVYDDLISQIDGVIHQTPLKSVPDILTQILGNKSDATVLELPVALGIAANNPEFSVVRLDNGFDVSIEDITVSIAVRLEDEELANSINSILAGITQEVREKMMNQAIVRENG
ncbi:MAG: transporter substrate-binding domain-containing protein [Bacilli bacterium]|nr:transporter substrate-binding domain-containing protein [Bacilli bacterium]